MIVHEGQIQVLKSFNKIEFQNLLFLFVTDNTFITSRTNNASKMIRTRLGPIPVIPYLTQPIIDEFTNLIIKSEDGLEYPINHLLLGMNCVHAMKSP